MNPETLDSGKYYENFDCRQPHKKRLSPSATNQLPLQTVNVLKGNIASSGNSSSFYLNRTFKNFVTLLQNGPK